MYTRHVSDCEPVPTPSNWSTITLFSVVIGNFHGMKVHLPVEMSIVVTRYQPEVRSRIKSSTLGQYRPVPGLPVKI
ncbi:hypothetical protein D3C80_1991940 [compost metagenome]